MLEEANDWTTKVYHFLWEPYLKNIQRSLLLVCKSHKITESLSTCSGDEVTEHSKIGDNRTRDKDLCKL